MASDTRPDIAIHTLNMAKNQKRAMLKDLRDVNRILKKVHEKESKVMFRRVCQKEGLCVIGFVMRHIIMLITQLGEK